MDAKERISRSRLYRQWKETPEAVAMRAHTPYSYMFLVEHPRHFSKVRDAFHIYLMTKKMLG